MSSVGTPSVISTTVPMPASAASIAASAANAAGTKIIVAFAPVLATASWQVSKTGSPCSLVVPPLPGVQPPTNVVPYSMHCRV